MLLSLLLITLFQISLQKLDNSPEFYFVITPWTQDISLAEDVQDVQLCMPYVRSIYVLYPGCNLSHTQMNNCVDFDQSPKVRMHRIA